MQLDNTNKRYKDYLYSQIIWLSTEKINRNYKLLERIIKLTKLLSVNKTKKKCIDRTLHFYNPKTISLKCNFKNTIYWDNKNNSNKKFSRPLWRKL